LGVGAIHGMVYLRETDKVSTRLGGTALFLLSAALAASMVYWKSLTLAFFNGIVAVGYSLLVTSGVNLGSVFLGVVASGAAVTAMNTSGSVRIFAVVTSCIAAVWLGRIRRGTSKEGRIDSTESGRDA